MQHVFTGHLTYSTHVEQLNSKVKFILPHFIYPALGSNTLLHKLFVPQQTPSNRPATFTYSNIPSFPISIKQEVKLKLVNLGISLDAFHAAWRHIKRLLPEVQKTLPELNML
jgi:hypothetical protein